MLLLIERARDGKCGAKRKIKRSPFFRSGPQLKHTTFMRRVANMQRRESREMWSLPFKKLKICVWKKKPCLSISPIKREKTSQKHVAGRFSIFQEFRGSGFSVFLSRFSTLRCLDSIWKRPQCSKSKAEKEFAEEFLELCEKSFEISVDWRLD